MTAPTLKPAAPGFAARFTPLQIMLFSFTCALLLSAGITVLAADIRRLSLALEITGSELVTAQAQGAVAAGTVVTGIALTETAATETAATERTGNVQSMALQASDLYEEPDFFPTYERYNLFLERQAQLQHILQADAVLLQLADGTQLTLTVAPLPWYRLAFMFWLQLAITNICVLMGMGVWSFRRHDPAARYYCAIGLAFAFIILPASVYSTRGLAMDAGLFRLLSVIDHFGLYMLIAFLVALLWSFPQPLSLRVPMVPGALAFYFVVWILDTLQWLPGLDFSTRILAMLSLAFGVTQLVMQWLRCRHDVQQRVAVLWFLQLIVIGCALFCFLVFLPPLFGALPVLSQGQSFLAFLTIYLSLAIGVARYRLFDLDRWWFEVWLWVAAGAVVIMLDFALAALLRMSLTQVGWVALAITGWLYFPVRQLLMGRFLGLRRDLLKNNLPVIVKAIASAENSAQLHDNWRACLQVIFQPSMLRPAAADSSVPAMDQEGLQLVTQVPGLQGRIIMEFAEHGRRLFNRTDAQVAAAVADLFAHAHGALEAKNKAVMEERERIKEDIHDSLGGQILAIMHQETEPLSREVARSAWRELRDILSALEQRREPLYLVLAQWKHDLSAQVAAKGLTLAWDVRSSRADGQEQQLSGFQRMNLGQLLREAVTNSLRHSQPEQLALTFTQETDGLLIRFTHDGCSSDPQQWQAGRGVHHMRKRVARMHGEICWQLTAIQQLELTVTLPLQ